LGDLGVDRKIILKWIFYKYFLSIYTNRIADGMIILEWIIGK